MRPEEIQRRDFLVGLRGYDKDEVRSFLAEVADEHAALLAELETARTAPEPVAAPIAAPVLDELEGLGASVAAILRTARESANEVTGSAEERAAAVREEAETAAAAVREQAEAHAAKLREEAEAHAARLREESEAHAAVMRQEAERLVAQAQERAHQIELEAEARVGNKLEEAGRREVAIRTRLTEAYDELQLALAALDAAPALVDVREELPAVNDEEAAAWS